MPTAAEWKARLKAELRTRSDAPDSRLSPVVEVAVLLAECIKANLRTIAFCKTRKLCELVATYTRCGSSFCAVLWYDVVDSCETLTLPVPQQQPLAWSPPPPPTE